MSANPFLYSNRHSRQILAQNPNMTRELYEKGFDRANSLVNTMIGIANEVARLAISDGIEAIKQGGSIARRPNSSAMRPSDARRSTSRVTTRTSANG